MTGDEKKDKAEKCLEQIQKSMHPYKDSVLTIIIAGCFSLVLGSFIVRDACYTRSGDEVMHESKGNIENTVYQKLVGAYPGPATPPNPHQQDIRNSAERHGLDERLLEGLMIASSEENANYRDIPEEYRSVILLNPERVGVLSRYLKADPALAIEQAARLYRRIRDGESDDKQAVAAFFAGRDRVARAVQEEKTKLDKIYDRGASYEKIFAHFKQQELRENPLNWVDNLEPWQREAVYITLAYIEMP